MTSMAAIPAQFQMGFLLSFLELWSLEISEMEISPGRTWGSTVRETKSPRPSTAHPRKSKPGPRLATVAVSRFTALGCVELAFLFLLPWSITFCHRLLFLMTKSEGLLVLLVRSPLSDSERRENREREGESESSVDKRPSFLLSLFPLLPPKPNNSSFISFDNFDSGRIRTHNSTKQGQDSAAPTPATPSSNRCLLRNPE
ncbi:uncharacterized protein LOC133707925 isoform X3 [Rosa rugosa]|nr:uncharacterized protein LOC133707925 isoform X3 [Rosa rugosa]